MSHDVVEDNNAEYNEDDVLGPLRAEPLGLDTETDAHITRDRSTSDAMYPPDVPMSSPQEESEIPSIPPALPTPFDFDGESSFALSIDAILATQTAREVAEENRKRAAVSKRASNVLKLTQENKDLERELREMAERLEAIEKRSQELAALQNGHPPPTTSQEE